VTTRAETTQGGLGDRETSLDPRTVLGKEVAERVPFASEFQARGRAAHVNPTRRSLYGREPERMSNHREGLRVNGLCALGRSRRQATSMTEHGIQAHPESVQRDVGLTRSAPDALWRTIGISHAVVRLNIE